MAHEKTLQFGVCELVAVTGTINVPTLYIDIIVHHCHDT